MTDRDEALGALADAIQAALEAGTEPDVAALARELGVDEEDAERCLASVRAMEEALANGLPDAESELPLPELPDDYEILGELGRGGMGVVYRARQKSLERVVAVKVVRPASLGFADAVRRFRKEARSLARLRHPGVVAVHDAGVAGDAVWYSMDVVEGGSLAARLRDGRLHPGEAVRILFQVADAVSHCHERGILHRDLKPANVLLDANGNPCIADFGLARDVALSLDGSGSSRLLGTPAYMAPEQASGDAAAVGEPTDVYALGALLHECLTGQAPFAGRSLAETIHAVIHEDPAAPRRLNPLIPRDLEAIVVKAMAKRPDRRYATARAFLEDLRAFAQGRPIRARRPGALRSAGRLLVRHRRTVAAGLVGAVVVAALAAWILGPRLGRSPATLASLAEELAAKGEPGAAAELFEEAVARYGWDGPLMRDRRDEPRDALAYRLETGLADARVAVARERLAAGDLYGARDLLDQVRERTERAFGEAGWPGQAELMWCRILVLTLKERPVVARELWDDLHGWLRNLDTLRESWRSGTEWRPFSYADEHVAALLARDLLAPAPAVRRVATEFAVRVHAGPSDTMDALRARLLDGREASIPALKEIVAAATEPGADVARLRIQGTLERFVESDLGPQVEEALADLAGDEARPDPARALALNLLSLVADLPRRPGNELLRWDQATVPPVLGLWRETRGLPLSEVVRRRVRFAIETDPDRFSGWLDAHTGHTAEDAEGWRTWWSENRDVPPWLWLARAAGLPEVPDPPAPGVVLRALRDAREKLDRHRLHLLLTLVAPEGVRAPHWRKIPFERERGIVEAWREALDIRIDEGAWVVRVAQFQVVNAGEPELLSEAVREAEIGAPVALECVTTSTPPLSVTLWPPGFGAPLVAPQPQRYVFRSAVRLEWRENGLYHSAGAIAEHAGMPGGGSMSGWSSSNRTMPAGGVLPFDALGHYSGYSDGRVVNHFALSVAEPPGSDPRPWTVDDWRAKVAENLAMLADGVEGEGVDPRVYAGPPSGRGFFWNKHSQAFVWLPQIAAKLEVPAAGEPLRRILKEDPDPTWVNEKLACLARLYAGDAAPLEKPSVREPLLRELTGSSMGDCWPAIRLLLGTRDPEIREFALEALRKAQPEPRAAARIETAIDEGRLDAPDWLRKKVAGARMRAGVEPYGDCWFAVLIALTVALIALLSLGFGLFPGRSAAARLPAAAGMVFAGVGASVLQFFVDGTDLLPDAAGFGLAVLGVWLVRRHAARGPWRVVFLGFLVAFVSRLLVHAGLPALPTLAPAGLGVAIAIVTLPYLARSMDPTPKRSRFALFHLCYTVPIVLFWAVGLVQWIGGGKAVEIDPTPANLVLLAAGLAIFSALVRLHAAARRAAGAEAA